MSGQPPGHGAPAGSGSSSTPANEIVLEPGEHNRRYYDDHGIRRAIHQPDDRPGASGPERRPGVYNFNQVSNGWRFFQLPLDSAYIPPFTVLDDRTVYHIISNRVHTWAERGRNWPLEFTQQGRIRLNRPNRGRAAHAANGQQTEPATTSTYNGGAYRFTGEPGYIAIVYRENPAPDPALQSSTAGRSSSSGHQNPAPSLPGQAQPPFGQTPAPSRPAASTQAQTPSTSTQPRPFQWPRSFIADPARAGMRASSPLASAQSIPARGFATTAPASSAQPPTQSTPSGGARPTPAPSSSRPGMFSATGYWGHRPKPVIRRVVTTVPRRASPSQRIRHESSDPSSPLIPETLEVGDSALPSPALDEEAATESRRPVFGSPLPRASGSRSQQPTQREARRSFASPSPATNLPPSPPPAGPSAPRWKGKGRAHDSPLRTSSSSTRMPPAPGPEQPQQPQQPRETRSATRRSSKSKEHATEPPPPPPAAGSLSQASQAPNPQSSTQMSLTELLELNEQLVRSNSDLRVELERANRTIRLRDSEISSFVRTYRNMDDQINEERSRGRQLRRYIGFAGTNTGRSEGDPEVDNDNDDHDDDEMEE